MRKNWIAAIAILTISLFAGESLLAADCGCQQQACGCQNGGDGCYGDPCDPCGDGSGHGGLFGRHHRRNRYEGLEAGFNCGCNGSYKFPVPPLYTYHWPGMWSAQLMTDYHSPWRFPPLKPYVDEVPVPLGIEAGPYSQLRPVSANVEVAAAASGHTTFSRHLEQMSR
jgi:hypothetical protein